MQIYSAELQYTVLCYYELLIHMALVFHTRNLLSLRILKLSASSRANGVGNVLA